MSTDERIAMLQALLARVKSRIRNEQRTPNAPAPAPSGHGATPNGHARHPHDDVFSVGFTEPSISAAPSSRPSPLSVPTPMTTFRPSSVPAPPASNPDVTSAPRTSLRPEAPPLSFAQRGAAPSPQFGEGSFEDTAFDDTWSEVPPVPRAAPPPASLSGVRPLDLDPPPMEVIELEVNPDPSLTPGAASPALPPAADEERLESRSRLVIALPAAATSEPRMPAQGAGDSGDDDEAFVLRDDLPTSDPTIEAPAVDASRAPFDDDFDEDPVDRAPSSSRRPISMEEKMSELEDPIPLHTPPPASGKLPAATPAIDLSLDVAPPPVSAVSPAQPLAEPPVVTAAPTTLPRESLRGEPLPTPEVALFVGRPPADDARPKTFGDLLDATLSL